MKGWIWWYCMTSCWVYDEVEEHELKQLLKVRLWKINGTDDMGIRLKDSEMKIVEQLCVQKEEVEDEVTEQLH